MENKQKTCLGYVPFLYCPAAPWGRLCSILLSEVEQEQRPSGNGDREAIVVGAGLCDGEGECAYTAYAPHFDLFAFRKPFSKHDYLDVIPVWSFRLIFLGEMTQLNF